MAEARAIIADDEDTLRRYLQDALARIWPELRVVGEARNGREALAIAQAERPDVAFLDIRMPGLSGLDVAEQLARQCWIVFVTAYDEFAVAAFEREAMDYLLKPVTDDRLARTAARLKARLSERRHIEPDAVAALVRGLSERLSPAEERRYLTWVKALHGDLLQVIAVDDVHYFKADDKYTIVVTAHDEAIIKTPLRQLAAELDPTYFWQIHRGIIVNARLIDRVERDFRGRYTVHMKGRRERLGASRSYASVFKHM